LATTARKAKPGRAPLRRTRQHGEVSLERALSKLGLASRTQARELIAAGRVTVDGHAITDPGRPVIPERTAIAIDGARKPQAAVVTVMLHKPRGVVTTRSDPDGRPTVYSLLHDLETRVVPVGRLDLATSGLLLLTSDTQFANWLSDPANRIPRVYLVTARGRVTPEIAAQLVVGRTIDGEHLSAARADVRKASNRETHLVVTLIEGKNREIRRLFDDLGHAVTHLRRIKFGALALGTLGVGQWRQIGEHELDEIFPGRPKRRKPL